MTDFGRPPDEKMADESEASIDRSTIFSQHLHMARGKTNRTRKTKACDPCRARKTKCDGDEIPCQKCVALDIPCTFSLPSRRRGPINHVAEAFKSQSNLAQANSTGSPSSSRQSQPDILALGAEAICPLDIIELLVDDYYTYIYPILPFPHRPWFLEAFRLRQDLVDKTFLALLAGMIGALVAAYPRRPRKRLKAVGKDLLFSNSLEFVKRCENVVNEARGVGYIQRDGLNSYDAMTSYYLFNLCAYTYRMREADLYLSESFAIVKSLGAHKVERHFQSPLPSISQQHRVSAIEREMQRRIYWTIFGAVRTGRTIDESFGDLNLNPPTATYDHPPFPLEVDDQYLFSDHIERQPQGIVPVLTGFNLNTRMYMTFEPLIASELSYASERGLRPEKQASVLLDCLEELKRVFSQIPNTFKVWRDPSPHSSSSDDNAPVFGLRDLDSHRSHIAIEIQKANIHGSYLTMKSHFVEKYWNLSRAMSTDISRSSLDPHSASKMNDTRTLESEIRAERESIANELLSVLGSIQPVHMEPNSVSFIMKIRLIAGTLLPSSDPDSVQTLQPDDKSAIYLQHFLKALTGLEKSGAIGRIDNESMEYGTFDEEAREEEELRRWADMRENQVAFAKNGRA